MIAVINLNESRAEVESVSEHMQIEFSAASLERVKNLGAHFSSSNITTIADDEHLRNRVRARESPHSQSVNFSIPSPRPPLVTIVNTLSAAHLRETRKPSEVS